MHNNFEVVMRLGPGLSLRSPQQNTTGPINSLAKQMESEGFAQGTKQLSDVNRSLLCIAGPFDSAVNYRFSAF